MLGYTKNRMGHGFILFLLACIMPIFADGREELNPSDIIKKMEAAYEGVTDYQAKVEVKSYKKDGSFEKKKFLYRFKKPNRIRLDFESPHSGMVLIYAHKDGKVLIRPSGWLRFLKIHLEPNNSLLTVSPGQRIDQTDLGLLIRNISHSVTDRRQTHPDPRFG